MLNNLCEIVSLETRIPNFKPSTHVSNGTKGVIGNHTSRRGWYRDYASSVHSDEVELRTISDTKLSYYDHKQLKRQIKN